jgi:hypothetical protein
MNHLVKFESLLNKKVIFNMYICDHDSDDWVECNKVLEDVKKMLPTSIPISKGHSTGLSIQVLLDTDIFEAEKISNKILDKFTNLPLIVISEVEVNFKNKPIGEYLDRSLIGAGRYFDTLLKSNKRGLFIC